MALTVMARSAYVRFRPQIASYCTQTVNKGLGNSQSLGTKSKNADVKCAILDHRKIVEINGRDTSDFLQGIITNDITFLPELKSMYAMLLHQNGRIMYDLILYHHLCDGESKIFMECDAKLVTNLVKNLKLYKIRKKVTIMPADDKTVMHFFKQNPSKENIEQQDVIGSMAKKSNIVTPDPRLPYFGHRVIVESSDVINSTQIVNDIEGYHAVRIKLGIPEGSIELPPGKCLPLECNLDYMNGVSFHKGCYVGQELTARTKFTGVIRKRIMPITISYTDNLSSQDVIESNTPLLTKTGKKAGKIQSMHPGGDKGLALIRLNYANETLFTKSGHVIDCNIPPWWPCEDGTKFSNGVCGPQ